MGRPKLNFEDQYTPVTESGCWIWLGGIDGDGYGVMSHNRRAHRESYMRAKGPLPSTICVCHKCDVRCCVNPAHLFAGTSLENNEDKVRKGRHLTGERAHKAKLTAADVAAILACDDPCFVIAERYGVTDTTISYIKLGKTWKQVPRPDGYTYVPYRAPATHERWAS